MLPALGGGAVQRDLFRAAARKDLLVNEEPGRSGLGHEAEGSSM